MILDSDILNTYDKAADHWDQVRLKFEATYAKRYNAWKYILDNIDRLDVRDCHQDEDDTFVEVVTRILYDVVLATACVCPDDDYEVSKKCSLVDIRPDKDGKWSVDVAYIAFVRRNTAYKRVRTLLNNPLIAHCNAKQIHGLLFSEDITSTVDCIIKEQNLPEIDMKEVRYLLDKFHWDLD